MTTDTSELEAAFIRLMDWIKDGGYTESAAGEIMPFRWRRAGWIADQMSASPEGPFASIHGPGFVAYLRPRQTGVAHMGRIDLRGGASPERLLELGRTPGPGVVSPASDRAPTVKTIRVRILVAVNHDGEWSAVGGSYCDGKKAKEYVYLDEMKEGEHYYYWVEADIPVPNNEIEGVLAGKVE